MPASAFELVRGRTIGTDDVMLLMGDQWTVLSRTGDKVTVKRHQQTAKIDILNDASYRVARG